MKKLTVLLVFILVIGISFTALGQDFRNVNWGMTKEEVKENESASLYEEESNLLFYTGINIAGNSYAVGYFFYDNKLSLARYILMERNLSGMDYIEIYKNMPDRLNSLYGDPSDGSYGIVWNNETYKDQPGMFKEALQMGHVGVMYMWDNEDIKVYFGMVGSSITPDVMIEYYPKEYKEEQQKIEQGYEDEATSQL
jgi:multidrug transporter EmrE-like cation transporter